MNASSRLIRRGNQGAFEVLVARYHTRLLAFCRHLLGSREDAEDVLQDVLTASYNAMLADDRPINVRPWLYRIARNRCLNHLRRNKAIGVDSMDIHYSDHGATTADKVHEREEFRQLLDDIRDLPESQRTALILREMDALSYEQIAETMETTVSSVKSLLVRARVSLTEAAEARLLSCDEVREELAEIAEGMRRKTTRVGAPSRQELHALRRLPGRDAQDQQGPRCAGAARSARTVPQVSACAHRPLGCRIGWRPCRRRSRRRFGQRAVQPARQAPRQRRRRSRQPPAQPVRPQAPDRPD